MEPVIRTPYKTHLRRVDYSSIIALGGRITLAIGVDCAGQRAMRKLIKPLLKT